MDKGILQLFENSPADFDLASFDDEVNLFGQVAGEIPHKFRERLQQRRDGRHEDFLHLLEKTVYHAPQRSAFAVYGRTDLNGRASNRLNLFVIPLQEIE